MSMPPEQNPTTDGRKGARLLSLIVAALFLFTFGSIAQEVAEARTLAFDRWIMLAFRDPANPGVPIGPAWLQEAARDLTSLGSMIVLGIIAASVFGFLVLSGNKTTAWLVLFTVCGGIFLNNLLKLAFARPRPDIVAPVTRVFTLSFPSSHAALSAITYLTIGALLAHRQSSAALRLYFMVLAALLTALIGMSRVYLGVHYPTDVLGGWCIGAAWALACWALASRLRDRRLLRSR
jgi:undecaprenyl-diphosphatase